MSNQQKPTYAKLEVSEWPIPNYWDALALILIIAIIFVLGWGAKAMLGQYQLGQTLPISLNPSHLPYYALRTVLRMFIGMFCSLIFTFVFATWAAKSRSAERIIIPAIDILQSVPILGFLSITVVGFVVLFKGSMLGPECAAIFALFTAQVWNMALSFYQSLRTLPSDLQEAARMFGLSAWQKFWRVEVPYAMPGLLWNMMISMSSSWVFLVASEAITVAGQDITLPGIGSYIAVAINHKNIAAIVYVIIAMFIVIALYDQLIFRPLLAWAEKFKMDTSLDEHEPESWLLDFLQRTAFLQFVGRHLGNFANYLVNFPLFCHRQRRRHWQVSHRVSYLTKYLTQALLILVLVVAVMILLDFIFSQISWHEGGRVLYLGLITCIRVLVLIAISSIIWVPIGVKIGLNPKASQMAQPIIQFLAAFPANLLFPIAVILIVRYQLNVNIWTSPLMILGTQWYILFNVIAGTTALPKNLCQAAQTIRLSGWLWWKRLALPGIFPYYITGAITAAGGAWNISIIAECVSWGNTTLHATGIGDYIATAATVGDFRRLALGIVVMSLYVLALNHFLWRPLYRYAEERFRIGH